jgi:hypothetical protein
MQDESPPSESKICCHELSATFLWRSEYWMVSADRFEPPGRSSGIGLDQNAKWAKAMLRHADIPLNAGLLYLPTNPCKGQRINKLIIDIGKTLKYPHPIVTE